MVFDSPIVFKVPPQNEKVFREQQLPALGTFSNLRQEIFSGGLNGTVGTDRTVTIRNKLHLSSFHWSIKGRPDAVVEIQLYMVINGVTKQIIRHGMPLFPWTIGQAANQAEFQDRFYVWNQPIVITPVTASDTIHVKCDGGSSGQFCLIYYEETIK